MKYELTATSLHNSRHNGLFQIKALKDFGHIKKGQLGGFVQSEHNLSQEGNCWIYPNASASDKSRVLDNAILRDFASLKDHARIYNRAVMLDNAKLEGFTSLAGDVIMKDNSFMEGYASAEADDVICRSPGYLHLDNVRITITDKYVTLDYIGGADHYRKREWFNITDEELDKKVGYEWRVKWIPAINNLIFEY